MSSDLGSTRGRPQLRGEADRLVLVAVLRRHGLHSVDTWISVLPLQQSARKATTIFNSNSKVLGLISERKLSKVFKEQVHRISCRVCDTRRSEIEHLTSRGVDSYKSLVHAALSSASDLETRRIGAWVLGRLPAKKSGMKAVMELLRDSDELVVAKAANSAGKLKLKGAVPLLIEILQGDGKAASEAIAALGEIRGKRAAQALLDLLASSGDLQKIWETAKKLPAFSSKNVTKKLIKLLKHNDGIVREAVAYSLGFKSDKEALSPLIDVALNEEELDVVRAQALESIGYLAPRKPAVADKIATLLNHPKIVIRFWTTCAIAQVARPSNKRVLADLVRLSTNDNALLTGWWTVSEEAKYALSCIFDKEQPDREWIDEEFTSSMTSFTFATGDSIKRQGSIETLTLTNGDTLITGNGTPYKFDSNEDFIVHTDQPGDSIVIEYKNGDNIAFKKSGVFQLWRKGKNMRVRRDTETSSVKNKG